MKFIVLLILVLYVGYVQSASSERINLDKQCENKARWAAEVFDLIAENPKVVLSGTDPEDINAFVFIRRWVKDGNSRDELIEYTKSRCSGIEV